jgi:phosphate transport system substrate-binding protein
MRRREFLKRSGLAGMAAAMTGLEWPFKEQQERDDLLIAGSTTLLPYLQLIAAEFTRAHRDVDIVVEGGGSGAGLIAVERGAIDIATMSRELSVSEDTLDLHNTLIGLTAVVLAVHPSMPAATISRGQIRRIYEGRIRNWQELGGPDARIRVHQRKEGSSTRKNIEEMVLSGVAVTREAIMHDSAAACAAAIAADPFGIGYLTPRDIKGVKPLAVDDIAVDADNILLGTYPLSRPLFLVLHGEHRGTAAKFVEFTLGPAAQQILASRGIQPVH